MSQPPQQQVPPGVATETEPEPDHGEHRCRGTGRLAGKAAVTTGGDSGIGVADPAHCRPGRPAEPAPLYVMLASHEASHVSRGRIAVTGGQPIL
ncbi:hypothetical protein [Streptomyces sp. NPDC057781]|uniref:hypothetical protein n=1 Tax=unclassified Streptomyces TaxID=2593676 RepID=UPI00369A62EB